MLVHPVIRAIAVVRLVTVYTVGVVVSVVTRFMVTEAKERSYPREEPMMPLLLYHYYGLCVMTGLRAMLLIYWRVCQLGGRVLVVILLHLLAVFIEQLSKHSYTRPRS